MKNLSVSPNPFVIGEHDEIIFSNISSETYIKIMTLNGNVIKDFSLNYNNERIPWTGKTDHGSTIPTGVYLVAGYNGKENTGVSKIAIINK